MIPVPRANPPTLREVQRMHREFDKIVQSVSAGGGRIRGGSAGSVTRWALARTGAVARKAVRKRTPRGSRPAEGRNRLARSVRGGVAKERSKSRIEGNLGGNDLQFWYRVGFDRKLVGRFQQGVAIEHGTRFMSARHVIRKALDDAAGHDGEKFRQAFLRQFALRVEQLARQANARVRRR